MKSSLIALALFALAAPASAQPNRSQHPGIGLLCELQFQPESTRVSSGDALALSRVAAWAQENPEGLVVLDGYPDMTVSNPQLGANRAAAVRDALIGAGVEPAQIVVAAYAKGGTHARRVAVWTTRGGFGAVEAHTASRGGVALPNPLLR